MKYMAHEDADLAVKSAGDLSALSAKKVLVLGATGMVGSVLSYALAKAGAYVSAAGRNAKLLEERFKDAQIKTIEIFDVTNPVIIRQAMTSDSFDFIVDCAAPADPKAAMEDPVEVLRDNFFGLDNVLSVLAEDVKAAERRGRKPETPVVLFVSSNAVYGQGEDGAACEKCAGIIDFTCPFGTYAVAKGASEALAAAYSRQFGLDVRVARPGIVYGPEFIPGDTRPFAVVLSRAAAGKDLLLPEGMGRVEADITYVSDCVAGLLAILARGEKGCYNVSNTEAQIDLATALKDVAKEAGVEVKEGSCSNDCSDGSCCTMKKPSCSDGSCCGGSSCSSESECCGKEKAECKFPRLTRLNCDKLQKLGWKPKVGPEDGIGLSLKALKK
ncbi:MAG: NAD-dependent epimerase/dehydratase family protein [Aeriscardovia sp.]|nr:NAD-dependent epimerase/dehydratase family protein [Aeriscardovia sp.]